jgi:hypothetical protein
MPSPKERSTRVWNILLVILLLCAGGEFILRGPLRFVHASTFNDYIPPYVQTRAWMQGEDPYSPQNLLRFWPPEANRVDFLSRVRPDDSLIFNWGIPTAYPLPTFALTAPLAALPWPIAQPVWLVITVLSFAVTVTSMMSFANLLPWTRSGLVFLAISLALAPFHTALAAGSIVSVAVAASAAAVWADSRKHEILAGLLLAAAVSLKPQIGLPFCFYYLVRRRWRIPAVAGGIVAILSTVAAVRLAMSGTVWLQSYLNDNRVLFARGSLGDFTEGNPIRFGLINSQVAAYALLHNRDAANLAAFALAAFAGLAWILLLGKTRRDDLALSTLVVLSFMPVYHRFYDATLLVFPLAWSLTAWKGQFRAMARAVFVVIIAVFLVPGGSALEQLQRAGQFGALRNYWLWNALVLPHESWSILILALLLLRAMHVSAVVQVPDDPAGRLS